MRFMVIVRSTPDIESGRLPSKEELERMGTFNEELASAGVLLQGDGLRASKDGSARIHFGGERPSVVDGPFTETKELIAGFWMVQMKSLEEAKEWFTRAPMQPGDTLEIRRVFEADDFGDALSPELRAKEERMRIGGLGK